MPDSPPPTSGALLLCIDLQPLFIDAIVDGPQVARRCSFAIQAALGLGLPVAFSEQVPQKLGGTAPALLDLVSTPTIYAKNTFSVLADDAIRDALKRDDIEHLILCGLETPICVYQTAIDALNENIQVTVLTDAVGARRPADSAICLDALARAGVHLLPAETVFYALLRDVKHPFFKTFTKLVKQHA